jgi:hypothetical protein
MIGLATYFTVMLPEVILTELFNLTYKVNDVAISYLCDELEQLEYTIDHIVDDDDDDLITLVFSKGKLSGELCVDRIKQQFEIIIRNDASLLLPTTGDWATMLKCLKFDW